MLILTETTSSDKFRRFGLTTPVYGLIVRAYVAQFYPLHEYMRTDVTVEVRGESFAAAGKTITRTGWRDVYAAAAAEEDGEEIQSLPQMRQGARVKCEGIEGKAKKTKPPTRFTEGTLLIAMENIDKYVTDPEQRKLLREGEGIGTPATRASIISELKRREFLAVQGRYVVSTELGRALIDVLPSEVTSLSLAAYYERMLKQVEAGSLEADVFVAEQIAFVGALVKRANVGAGVVGTMGPACPTCKEGHLRRLPAKEGKGFFWGCDRFSQGCKTSFEDKVGRPDIPTKTYMCPECGKGALRKITGAKGVFWGCVRYQEGCKATFDDSKGKPVAPGKK